ncbi:hypothetical protein ScPMuIL_015404 [Solemya velum]
MATFITKSWSGLVYRCRAYQKLAPCRRAHAASSFKFEDLQVSLTSNPQPKPDPEKLLFGHQFADHMLEIEWNLKTGWGHPIICPVHNFSLHPSAKVFHYATELFEGMKAYRGVDNKIRLFRPHDNMIRMNDSAKRASLPAFNGEELLKCLKKLVMVDQDWVPDSTSTSLYLRPTMIGTEESLGVAESHKAVLFVLSCPVGPYFPTGMKPVSLLADPKYVRAWPGGTGWTKMGSNYAPTISVLNAAHDKGCQQVLWLFGENHTLTEVGTMNLFTFWTNEQGEEELVTPPLSGLILAGITRQTLLDMARQWGKFKVSERNITMKDIIKALNENRLKEMFGAGTACIVCPVERISYKDEWLDIPTMKDGGPVVSKFLKDLTDIQYGRVSSEWTVIVD